MTLHTALPTAQHTALHTELHSAQHIALHTALHDSEGSAQSGAALCDVTLTAAAELAGNTAQLCTEQLRIAQHRTAQICTAQNSLELQSIGRFLTAHRHPTEHITVYNVALQTKQLGSVECCTC